MNPRAVVVTGAANGIGRAVSRRLASDGWLVVAADTDGPALDTLVEESRAGTDTPIRSVVGDLTDPHMLQRILTAAADLGVLSGWVNNAGVLDDRPLHELDPPAVDHVLGVNLVATINGTAAAVCSFLASGTAGAIVNLSSIHARHPFAGHPIYAASKGAIEALTRQVCVEYGAAGIRCNAVAPGAVATRMTIDAAADPAAADQQRQAAEALSPMGRVSSPEEIADAVAFLLSDQARSINGHVLAVDNGMAAHGRVPS